MLRVARSLDSAGFEVLRFNFPYQEKGSRRIDPMPVLQRRFSEVVESLGRNRKIIIGGRSMGGRVASMMAADGFACDGLLLLAYPLHPAGKPEALRSAHLPRIAQPVLCVSGTRDALCTRELMERARVGPRWTMYWIEGADHSFRVLKSSGRTEAEVDAEVAAAARRWSETL